MKLILALEEPMKRLVLKHCVPTWGRPLHSWRPAAAEEWVQWRSTSSQPHHLGGGSQTHSSEWCTAVSKNKLCSGCLLISHINNLRWGSIKQNTNNKIMQEVAKLQKKKIHFSEITYVIEKILCAKLSDWLVNVPHTSHYFFKWMLNLLAFYIYQQSIAGTGLNKWIHAKKYK